MTTAQKELLYWHFKLGDFNLSWIQALTRVREGEEMAILPTRMPKTSTTELPLCAACQVGKAHIRPDGTVRQEK